jgi:hypothetical protein
MTEERPQAPDGGRLAGLDRPLRNRVTPAGELIATEHRGTMYGNRGVLHNENLALVRRYQVRRWLVCVLEFRGRRRPIMRPRRYTELFFLDEAVALAAGHRPCAECRHADYQSFRTAWTAARAFPAKPAADDIDQVLHWQRRLVDGARVTYPALLSELPDGVFIVHDEEFWLANDGGLHRWTPAGYTDRIEQFDGPAAVLTPRATVETIRAGYRPLVHSHALPDRVCGLIRRCPVLGVAPTAASPCATLGDHHGQRQRNSRAIDGLTGTRAVARTVRYRAGGRAADPFRRDRRRRPGRRRRLRTERDPRPSWLG